MPPVLSFLDVVLALGLTVRLTRAVTVDAIGGRYLRWPVQRWADRATPVKQQRRQFWADGLTCPFCVSTWIGIGSFAVMVWAWWANGWWLDGWRIVAAGLTASWLLAHLMVAVGDVNDDDDDVDTSEYDA